MFENMRAFAEVNLDNIRQNVLNIQKHIGEKTKILAVIKADGYGHGSIPIAKYLSREKLVWGFGVSTVREAVVLRKAGINMPVLILGYVFPADFETVIRYGITTTVFQLETAKALSNKASECGETARIHIKIDTGMGRIGFAPNEKAIDDIEEITKLPFIEVEGLFTHFACADCKDKTSAYAQLDKFKKIISELEKRGIYIPIKHACNSAGIIEFDDDHFDLVRAGIIIYGLYPSEEVNKEKIRLRPAMSVKSRVSYVKTVPAGTAISYGSVYVTESERKIATISIGYADGILRALTGKGEVIIRGKRAKIVGKICMDQMMADVTDIDGVSQGDFVTVIGRDGGEEITMEEISEKAGTFNYEFVCGFQRRVPRIYTENGHIIKILDYLEETI